MDKLLNYIQDFVGAFNDEVVAQWDEESAVDFSEDGIVLRLTTDIAESDFYFVEHLYRGKKGKKMPLLHPFTLTILHELGHIMTMDRLKDHSKAIAKINASGKSVRDSHEAYVRLHNEAIANKWLRKFCVKNNKLIRKVDTQIVAMLKGE